MYTLHLPPSFAHTTLRASPHSYLHMVIHLHKPTSFACTHPPLLVLSHQQLSLSFACTALAHAQAPSFANNSFPGLTSLGIGSHHTHLHAGILLCLCTLISMHWPAFAREQLKTSQASHVRPSVCCPPSSSAPRLFPLSPGRQQAVPSPQLLSEGPVPHPPEPRFWHLCFEGDLSSARCQHSSGSGAPSCPVNAGGGV